VPSSVICVFVAEADDAEDAGGRAQRLRALDRLGGSVGRTEHRVLVDERDFRLLVRAVVLGPVEVRPVDLVDPDGGCRAGERRHQPDLTDLPALDQGAPGI
jgi:hypothetical protein